MRSFWKVAGTWLVLALLALPVSAAPKVAGEGVRARLEKIDVLRGDFTQQKRVQGFRNPLRSSGAFLLSRDKGVVWHTKAPFASTLVLTPDQLAVRQADGSRQALAGGSGRAAALANSLMMALVAGDVAALSRRFKLSETLRDEGAWTLVLVPREPALRKAIARIELSGASHVTAVRIEETSGDHTDLAFAQLRSTPATLTAAEAAQFE